MIPFMYMYTYVAWRIIQNEDELFFSLFPVLPPPSLWFWLSFTRVWFVWGCLLLFQPFFYGCCCCQEVFAHNSRVFTHIVWRDILVCHGRNHSATLIGRFAGDKVHWFVILLRGFHAYPARWRWCLYFLVLWLCPGMPSMGLVTEFEAELFGITCIFREISKVAQCSTVPRDLMVSIKDTSYTALPGIMQINEQNPESFK